MKQNMIALLAGLSAAALVGCQSKPETPERDRKFPEIRRKSI